jgi:hypothetical protein
MASAWVYLMSLVRGPSMIDAKRKARLHADQTIKTLQEHETELQNELRALANTARQAQKQAAAQHLRSTLAKSKATRQQLTLLVKKRQALQAHLDTLKNSELNEQVLSSVKQTSSVLKTMGLDQSLSDMDAVVADMQDAQSDLNALQEGLSEGLGGTTDEDDLELELEMLLSDSDATMPMLSSKVHVHAMPVPNNSMNTTEAPEKVDKKASALKGRGKRNPVKADNADNKTDNINLSPIVENEETTEAEVESGNLNDTETSAADDTTEATETKLAIQKS